MGRDVVDSVDEWTRKTRCELSGTGKACSVKDRKDLGRQDESETVKTLDEMGEEKVWKPAGQTQSSEEV